MAGSMTVQGQMRRAAHLVERNPQQAARVVDETLDALHLDDTKALLRGAEQVCPGDRFNRQALLAGEGLRLRARVTSSVCAIATVPTGALCGIWKTFTRAPTSEGGIAGIGAALTKNVRETTQQFVRSPNQLSATTRALDLAAREHTLAVLDAYQALTGDDLSQEPA